jgi:hypothetical protein
MDTASTATDITKMKNADSLSTKKPKFRNEEVNRVKLKVSPRTTEKEKMIPKTEAMDAAVNETSEDDLSFLLSITDNTAPMIKKMISPEKK